MAQVVNTATGQLEDLSHDTLPTALQSGKYNMVPGQNYNLLNPDGNPVNLAAEDVPEAVQQGFTFPSQQAVDGFLKEQDLNEKYGPGAANSLKAAAAGAARGASFGLSDAMLTKSGAVDPQTLLQLRNRHPIASTAGAVAGIAGGLMLGTGEAGAAAEGAGAAEAGVSALNLPAQVSQAGAALTKAVTPTLGRIGAAALGSAAEGAAYGVGNVVSEAMLGDPALNGEKALSEIGYSALLGGGIGGAFSTAADSLPPIFNQAKSLFAPEGAVMRAGAKLSSLVSGKPMEEILEAAKTAGDALNPNAAEKMTQDLTESLQKQYDLVNQASLETAGKLRGLETKELVDNTMLPGAQEEATRLYSRVEDTIKSIRENPELYDQKFAGKLNLQLNTLIKADQTDAASIFESHNDFKKWLGDELNYSKKIPVDQRDTMRLLESLKQDFKGSLENEDLWGDAASRQSAFNEADSDFLRLQRQVQKDVMKGRLAEGARPTLTVDPKKIASALKDPDKLETLQAYHEASKKLLDEIENTYENLPGKQFDRGAADEILGKNTQLQDVLAKNQEAQKALKRVSPAPGSENPLADFMIYKAGSALGPVGQLGAVGYAAVKDPALLVRRLGAIDKVLTRAHGAIEDGAQAVFRGAAKTGTAVGATAIPRVLSTAEFNKKTGEISKYANNPEQMVDRLSKSTRGAYSSAPNTVTALHTATARAVSFLQSKIPQTGVTAPLDGKAEIPTAQRSKFSRYAAIVDDPSLALKQIKEGTVTPETVETLQAVYPQMYEQMRSKLLESMAEAKAAGKQIPTRLKSSLSLFMGSNMTSSLSPITLQKLQGSLGANQAASQQANMQMTQPKATLGGLKQLGVSSRAATSMQTAANRSLNN